MKNSFEKNLSRLTMRPAPQHLLGKIMSKILLKQRKRAFWRFIVSSAVFVSAAALLIPVVNDVHTAMVNSGSYQYLSLLFSNFSEVASSWQDFALSVLEYLPIFSIAIFLATVFFLLGALRYVSRDGKFLFFKHL